MRLLILLFIFVSGSAFAAPPDVGSITCALRYEIVVGPGQVKYVTPKNGDTVIHLLEIKFCYDTGCEMKRVGSTFLGSNEIGGASLRMVGDRTTVILRDSYRNRSSISMNSKGLLATADGPTVFTLNAEGTYEGEPISRIIFACSLDR